MLTDYREVPEHVQFAGLISSVMLSETHQNLRTANFSSEFALSRKSTSESKDEVGRLGLNDSESFGVEKQNMVT